MKTTKAIASLFVGVALSACALVCFAQDPTQRMERIHRKAQLVEQMAKQWMKEGRNPSQAMSIMNRASKAFDGGEINPGETLVDEALQALQRPDNEPTNHSVTFSQPTASLSSGRSPNLSATSYHFSNPEPVTLRGYSGSQQDPNISRDGQYLFFDTHDDIGTNAHLYYAKRIDYKSFQYIGQVPGTAQYGDLQIEASEDSTHHLYFVSCANNGTTIERGIFDGRSISAVEPVKAISRLSPLPGTIAVNMDLCISADGKMLYFTDAFINPQKGIQGAHSSIATRNSDGTFTRWRNSGEILKNINALSALVYNATVSPDNLMLAFNASPGFPNSSTPGHIYIATRSSTTEPFGPPVLIDAADIAVGNLSEPGSFSPDGKYLYFHRVLSATGSQLYVLTRQ